MAAAARPSVASSPASRPYFSANSVRPGKITAVPRGSGGPAQVTTRRRTPSAAVIQAASTPSRAEATPA